MMVAYIQPLDRKLPDKGLYCFDQCFLVTLMSLNNYHLCFVIVLLKGQIPHYNRLLSERVVRKLLDCEDTLPNSINSVYDFITPNQNKLLY